MLPPVTLTLNEDHLVTLLQQDLQTLEMIEQLTLQGIDPPESGPDVLGVFLEILGIPDGPLREVYYDRWRGLWGGDHSTDAIRTFVRVAFAESLHHRS